MVEDAVGKQELIFGEFEVGDEIAEVLIVGTPAMQQDDRAQWWIGAGGDENNIEWTVGVCLSHEGE